MKSGWSRKIFGPAAALAIAGSAAAGQIRIWPTAIVTADVVRLSDIAELRSFDAEAIARLNPIVVYVAPRAGGEVLVQAADVRGALADIGENLAKITLVGASRCKVSRPRPAVPDHAATQEAKPATPGPTAPKTAAELLGQPRTPPRGTENRAPGVARIQAVAATAPETLEERLRQFILARTPDRGGRIEIRFGAASRRFLELSEPEYQFLIHPPENPRRQQTLGLMSLRADVYHDSELTDTVPVVAEVKLALPVVVARKPINRGQTIEMTGLRLEDRLFDDWAQIGLTELNDVVGQESQEFIKPGEMLTAKAIRPKPLVRRGDPVTIWNQHGGLVIKTTGKAQQDGFLGSQITVRRDGTRRAEDLIDAIVTGPQTVEVAGEARVAQR